MMQQAEYQAAQNNAAIVDVSDRSKIEVRGEDRASFLQGYCTNDVVNLSAGAGCEAFFTNIHAKILAYATVYKTENSIWIDADREIHDKLIPHLEHYLVTEDVELIDQTEEYGQLGLIGPQAISILSKIFAIDVSGWEGIHIAELSRDDSHYQLRSHPLSANTFHLLFQKSKQDSIQNKLLDQGAMIISPETYELLRVEAGFPEYGKDIDERNLPQEVGRIEQAISWSKGCYLGQEPVVRIRDLGHVNWTLMGLSLQTEMPAPRDAPVLVKGKAIGRVTSSVVSPRLGTAIAMAYLRRGSQEPGTSIQVDYDTDKVAGEVVMLPFVG